jgi:hypothetical protein
LYKNFAQTLSARIDGTKAPEFAGDFPSVEDGIRGMAFIDNVVKSGQSNEKWTKYEI